MARLTCLLKLICKQRAFSFWVWLVIEDFLCMHTHSHTNPHSVLPISFFGMATQWPHKQWAEVQKKHTYTHTHTLAGVEPVQSHIRICWWCNGRHWLRVRLCVQSASHNVWLSGWNVHITGISGKGERVETIYYLRILLKKKKKKKRRTEASWTAQVGTKCCLIMKRCKLLHALICDWKSWFKCKVSRPGPFTSKPFANSAKIR